MGIKQSGLSYTIIRVAGYNAEIGTDSSAVRLQKMNKNITAVSRVDLAQVIASALLTPNACNLILYMTKAQQPRAGWRYLAKVCTSTFGERASTIAFGKRA